MFSSTSSSRRSGLSEGNGTILLDLPPQALLKDGFSDNIDWPLQNFFEPMREFIDPAEIGEYCHRRLFVEPHQYVDVGIIPLLASCRRTDQRKARNAGSPQFRF